MRNLLMIAAVASFGLVFASPANAGGFPPFGIHSGTIVFAENNCKLGYEWNQQKKKCMKAERDY